jgi:hypothetical protein
VPVRLTYEGPPDLIERLVTHLRDSGCEVAHRPPPVHPDIIVEEVRVTLRVARGASRTTIAEFQMIDALVNQFTRRSPHIRIVIEPG